jgi:hypothetical protein
LTKNYKKIIKEDMLMKINIKRSGVVGNKYVAQKDIFSVFDYS